MLCEQLLGLCTFVVQEKDPVIRILSVISNIVDQSFFPIEHIAWAIDRGIIQSRSSLYWWYCGTALWAVSLLFSIVKCVLSLLKLQLRKKRESSSSRDSGVANSESLKRIAAKQFNLCLVLCGSCADFCCAVHWLPRGFLWAEKLSKFMVGFLGTVSSSVGLYGRLCQLGK